MTKDREGAPRWVKVFALVAVVIVALFIVLAITGRGGEHGPGRHTAPGDDRNHAPPAGAHTQP